ncbi:Threonine dehydratase [Granulibacter bethesdensis]|uniref:L-threonine dehydratase catabolic TdcB n=1 Tax=Granulibacter bethesdensis TaxID=364410 RepID=A0AAN0RFW2_9PROT|nr:threonine ammonia-lyase [Granulibacter bethesdensis]AHJ64194.1 Threonine dehydratase [Granulibacter bethesdensis]
MIGLEDVRAAAERIAGKVVRTPTLRNGTLSQLADADIWLKLDVLQATGAFKERGAANRLAMLSAGERAAGVVAMSAGNHAQAVARHAQLLGIEATIVMPRFTPATKVTRTAQWGAHVVLHGKTLAEAAEHAWALAAERSLTFIHPYDDEGVMAGQGTHALEMLEDAPDLDTLIIPIGGGGLIAGCAVAAKAINPAIRIYGVEAEGYDAMVQALQGRTVEVGGSTIAEGIAVRDVGQLPLDVVRTHVDDILVVTEVAIENAISLLAENAKIVTEGAGATGVAGLLSFPDLFKGRKVGIPLCGANIDSRILAHVLQRVMLRDGRLMRLVLDIPDRPGVLAEISARIGDSGGNIIEVSHHRLFTSPSVKSARLEIMFEARDPEHGAAVAAELEKHYTVTRL